MVLIYYFSVYFGAKLFVYKQLIAGYDLIIKSNGWIGTIEYNPVPEYFVPLLNDFHDLSVPLDIKRDISESEEPLFTIYHYINDLGNVSGDDFRLQANWWS